MLNEILGLEILVASNLESSEIKHLIKQLECAELAQAKFIKGELKFSDYCDILQLCDVNIDGYLIQVEDNLHEIGLM